MLSDSRVPVTIITGYLGAGKTSLLKNLLATTNKKLAIIMNEFGDLDIDGKLIEGKNVTMSELSGGCVCCSMTGEFELAVKEILEKAKPDWIIIETTGVAEPSALSSDIQNELEMVRLDAIVTVVDGDAMIRFPSIGHTGLEQIEMANVLLLNKLDLLTEKQVSDVNSKLRSINPNAIIAKSIRGKVPAQFLFGINKQSSMQKHTVHTPEEEFFTYECGSVDEKKFRKFAERLLPAVFRAKGFVLLGKKSFSFNYVAGRFELEPFAAEKTQLVFIGKGVLEKKDKIIGKLEKCKS